MDSFKKLVEKIHSYHNKNSEFKGIERNVKRLDNTAAIKRIARGPRNRRPPTKCLSQQIIESRNSELICSDTIDPHIPPISASEGANIDHVNAENHILNIASESNLIHLKTNELNPTPSLDCTQSSTLQSVDKKSLEDEIKCVQESDIHQKTSHSTKGEEETTGDLPHENKTDINISDLNSGGEVCINIGVQSINDLKIEVSEVADVVESKNFDSQQDNIEELQAVDLNFEYSETTSIYVIEPAPYPNLFQPIDDQYLSYEADEPLESSQHSPTQTNSISNSKDTNASNLKEDSTKDAKKQSSLKPKWGIFKKKNAEISTPSIDVCQSTNTQIQTNNTEASTKNRSDMDKNKKYILPTVDSDSAKATSVEQSPSLITRIDHESIENCSAKNSLSNQKKFSIKSISIDSPIHIGNPVSLVHRSTSVKINEDSEYNREMSSVLDSVCNQKPPSNTPEINSISEEPI